MGFFGFGTKTKADWDREIIRLNGQLADAKAALSQLKVKHPGINSDGAIHHQKFLIEQLKAKIANAKIERRNAPK